MDLRSKIILLSGPTASGKSSLAIKIANKINYLARLLSNGLAHLDFEQENEVFFDTLKIKVDKEIKKKIRKSAEEKQINLRYFEDLLLINLLILFIIFFIFTTSI